MTKRVFTNAEVFEPNNDERKSLRHGITIFPWETTEFELDDLNASDREHV